MKFRNTKSTPLKFTFHGLKHEVLPHGEWECPARLAYGVAESGLPLEPIGDIAEAIVKEQPHRTIAFHDAGATFRNTLEKPLNFKFHGVAQHVEPHGTWECPERFAFAIAAMGLPLEKVEAPAAAAAPATTRATTIKPPPIPAASTGPGDEGDDDQDEDEDDGEEDEPQAVAPKPEPKPEATPAKGDAPKAAPASPAAPKSEATTAATPPAAPKAEPAKTSGPPRR